MHPVTFPSPSGDEGAYRTIKPAVSKKNRKAGEKLVTAEKAGSREASGRRVPEPVGLGSRMRRTSSCLLCSELI